MNAYGEHLGDTQPVVTHGANRLEGTPLMKFFEAAVKFKASDLLIKPGLAPKLRLRGELKDVESKPFTAEQLEEMVQQFLTDDQMAHYRIHGSYDLACELGSDNRFRVNVYRACGHSLISARRVSSEILSYADLHLPPVLSRITETHQGLVLVCGITGSGKSTTIASMLQEINEQRRCHIVTIEDPIEYLFKDAKAVVSQREIGVDVPDFNTALRSLVRENPDVVLIGELRDHESFEAALRAAETGHLVFGTIHASSASQAFGRIYNLFPPDQRDLIRDMLAKTLRAIVYQKLLPALPEAIDRIPAVEILRNNPVVSKYILEQREVELGDVIRSSVQEGMIDFAGSLVDLVKKEYIHSRTAVENAHNVDELKMRLKGISTS